MIYIWIYVFSQSGFVFIYLKIVYKTKNLSKNFVLKKFLLRFTVSFSLRFSNNAWTYHSFGHAVNGSFVSLDYN